MLLSRYIILRKFDASVIDSAAKEIFVTAMGIVVVLRVTAPSKPVLKPIGPLRA